MTQDTSPVRYNCQNKGLRITHCFSRQLLSNSVDSINGSGGGEKYQCKTADFLNVNQIIKEISFQGN